jgi:hypothetical protein
MQTSGPIQVLGVGFDGDARFEGAIGDELERLERDGLVHVVAVLFIHKDAATGELQALDLQADAAGEVTDLLGSNGGDQEPNVLLDALGLGLDDVQEMAHNLEPGASAGLLLMEHVWARGLHDAIRATHGTPFLQGYVAPQAAA